MPISKNKIIPVTLMTLLAAAMIPTGTQAEEEDAGPIPCDACGDMVWNWHVGSTNYVDAGAVGFFDDLNRAIFWGALGQVTCNTSSGSGSAFMYASPNIFDSGDCGGGYAPATSPPAGFCTMDLWLESDTIDGDGSGGGACGLPI